MELTVLCFFERVVKMNRNFRLLWLGKLISQLGDKFYAIALSWWILQRTNSTVLMGSFLLSSTIPAIIFGCFSGAITDRCNKKTLMIITDVLRGSFVLLIACFSYLDMLDVWQVFLIGIALSMVSAFFDPASQAILPELVESEQLKRANSLCQLVNGFCMTLGPLLGALIVSILGMSAVFLANSLSFYIAAILSLLLRYQSGNRITEEIVQPKLLKDIKEGFLFLRGRSNMITILVIIGVAHFFVGSLSVALPFLANSLDGKGVNNLGLLETMMGAGLIIGSVISALRVKKATSERSLFTLMTSLGLCFVGISAAKYGQVSDRNVYLPILFLVGIIIANASIFWQLLLQRNTPAAMTGRIFGLSTLIGNTSLPIAYGITGILLEISSVPIVMLGSGGCLVLLGIGLYSKSIIKVHP
jgi:MFS family permease